MQFNEETALRLMATIRSTNVYSSLLRLDKIARLGEWGSYHVMIRTTIKLQNKKIMALRSHR